MLFPFSTNRTGLKKSSRVMEKPQSFFVSWITDDKLVGEVHFCFAVTLLVPWT